MNTPVLFLVFNRPEPTRKVFEAIRKARPAQLYIAADGAREGKEGEALRCAEVRKIVSEIDWPCEVKTLFREQNLGCGKSVSGAISWFFEQVEYGIILEDDCLPEASFFTFCDNLLPYYKDNEKIMQINGHNFDFNSATPQTSYYFSRYPIIWGWATWRRAWKQYDYLLSDYETHKAIVGINPFWKSVFDRVYADVSAVNTWDYQWVYTVWKKGGICISPRYTLVQNIGFGEYATHTPDTPEWYFKLQRNSVNDCIHPLTVLTDNAADSRISKLYYNPAPISVRVLNLAKRIVKKGLQLTGLRP